MSELGDAGHSLENLAEDVKTVVLGLDLHDAVLVGHSMGGVAVQEFVTRFPELAAERVAGIVLLSTLAYTPFGSRSTRTKARIEKLTKRTPDATWLWERRNLGSARGASRVRNEPAPEPRRTRSPDDGRLPRRRRAATRRACSIGLDLTEALPNVRIPTLVIGGTADALTPPSEARRMARLIPGARLELLEGGGHMLMLERTEQLNRLIVDFAREVRAGALRSA